MKFPTLLIATDLQPKTEAAIARGARLAASLRAETTLLHALPTESAHASLRDRTKDALVRVNEIAAQARWPVAHHVNAIVRAGSPANVIIEAVAELRPDLLVLGPHSRRLGAERLSTAITGNIAERTLAAKVCPVLVVREPPSSTYRRILFALDLSTTALHAVRAAESLVVTPDADLSVLHASTGPYLGAVDHLGAGQGMSARQYASWRSRATISVRSLLRQASQDFSRYQLQIEDQPPARAILEAMHTQEPDLLVLGTSGRGPWGRALIGSVANEVLGAAWCDVLVVPEVVHKQGVLMGRNALHSPDRSSGIQRHRWQ